LWGCDDFAPFAVYGQHVRLFFIHHGLPLSVLRLGASTIAAAAIGMQLRRGSGRAKSEKLAFFAHFSLRRSALIAFPFYVGTPGKQKGQKGETDGSFCLFYFQGFILRDA
jgi:hypothetical protein